MDSQARKFFLRFLTIVILIRLLHVGKILMYATRLAIRMPLVLGHDACEAPKLREDSWILLDVQAVLLGEHFDQSMSIEDDKLD